MIHIADQIGSAGRKDTQMRVPFVDLKAQYAALRPAVDEAIQGVLAEGEFILGEALTEFERSFARYIGVKHAVGVSSGTDALELALRALNIGPGDEVITVPNTYIATCEAISHVGATIRWVEADERTYNLSPERIEAAITANTAALLPVHLYGQPADMSPIMEIARRHRLKVIEDCSQAHGAKYEGRTAGTFGDVACFSFYPAKNLGAYGDGGAVLTNDDSIRDRVCMLRNHGQQQKYVHLVEGYCRRLANLQAAVLNTKLPYLDEWNGRRRARAKLYDELLADVPAVTRPFVPPNVEHVYHLYVVQVPGRDRVRQILGERGVETGIHYPIPLHEQPAYRRFGCAPGDFPVSHALGRSILSLPMFPELTEGQVEYVVEFLKMAVSD